MGDSTFQMDLLEFCLVVNVTIILLLFYFKGSRLVLTIVVEDLKRLGLRMIVLVLGSEKGGYIR